jgi:hypothetical protein
MQIASASTALDEVTVDGNPDVNTLTIADPDAGP